MKISELPSYEEAKYNHEAEISYEALSEFIFENDPEQQEKSDSFRQRLVETISDAEYGAKKEQADKILQRLSVIFTNYKNAGFENSVRVTKFIMAEIEQIVKV